MRKIPDYEEQKILGGDDATAEYVQSAKTEFDRCMRKIFLEIAKKAFNREENIAESVTEKAVGCWKSYFQSMKGGVNLTEEDIEEAIKREEERQKRFYNALTKLTEEFRRKGFQTEILPPDEFYRDSFWNTGLTAGCNIKVNNVYLCAFPLVPAVTSDFMVLRHNSAANVILINEDCVLLQPHDQTLEKEFWKANEEMFAERDVKDDFPEADFAILKNNFLFLVSSEILSNVELEGIRKKYNVVSIVKGDLSNFNAFIYTGKDEEEIGS
jgi:hypothetical protein